jgi:hypothetical protein
MTFNPSSIPIMLPHFSELDNVYDQVLMRTCVKKKVKAWREKRELCCALFTLVLYNYNYNYYLK